MSDLYTAARRYALADPSDPWAYARACAHIRLGIASPRRGAWATERQRRLSNLPVAQPDQPAAYDAEPVGEIRYLPDGRAYRVTVWINRQRP